MEQLLELEERLSLLNDLDLLAMALVALTARALFETCADLSLLQWRALVELDRGPLRLGDLAERLPASMSASSRLIKRMTTRGLFATRPVPADGRGISVQLTGEGRQLRSAVLDRRRRLIASGIGPCDLPADLHAGLATLAEQLRIPRDRQAAR
jgi:DNA-binding MarR family transcriptional regulator